LAMPLPIAVRKAIYMRGHSKDTQWHYAHNNAQLCMHQSTMAPPQAFKHCLATMRARGRKQGSPGRDNDLAAMYSTPGSGVCEMMGGGSIETLVCCSVMQCGAVCCSVLQCVSTKYVCSQNKPLKILMLRCVAVCCSQYVAACCRLLQCVAEYCCRIRIPC